MGFKSTPISFRLPEDDAVFLAGLKVEEATSMSEKIRFLIRQARLESQEQKNYSATVNKFLKQFDTPIKNLMELEQEQGIHSELIKTFSNWITESCSFYVNELTDKKQVDLERIEDELGTKIFLFIEQILRMAVTEKANCYNRKIIRNKIKPSLELFQVMSK